MYIWLTNPMIFEKCTKAAVWATLDWDWLSPGDVRKTPKWLSHRVCDPTFEDIPDAEITSEKYKITKNATGTNWGRQQQPFSWIKQLE